MKEIYIVEASYIPTAASTNRLFALGHELFLKGIKVHFFYLLPDEKRSVSTRFTNEFEFHYLWQGVTTKSKIKGTIISIMRFRKMLTPDIPVYVYSLLNCLFFIEKKGVRVFHEYTENPKVVGFIDNFLGRMLYNLYRKALKKVEGVFVICSNLKNYYLQNFGIEEDKIEILNMVVDPHRFDSSIKSNRDNVITYCGIISERKDGISYLIKAFKIFKDNYPDYKLQVIGRFENKETEIAVKKLLEDLTLTDCVIFTGPVEPSKMPLLLCSSKVLALARPDEIGNAYGFATKVGEYLMSEVPVVMTIVGNVEDYLTDKNDVVFARPNDFVDFAEKLIWVVEHYDEAILIGQNGRQTALNCFNPQKEVNKIINRLYC